MAAVPNPPKSLSAHTGSVPKSIKIPVTLLEDFDEFSTYRCMSDTEIWYYWGTVLNPSKSNQNPTIAYMYMYVHVHIHGSAKKLNMKQWWVFLVAHAVNEYYLQATATVHVGLITLYWIHQNQAKPGEGFWRIWESVIEHCTESIKILQQYYGLAIPNPSKYHQSVSKLTESIKIRQNQE